MNAVTEILSAVGDGLKSFLPSVAEAGVDTVDTLFVTSDGTITTLAVITIVGFVVVGGKKILGIIQSKANKI